MDTSIKIFNPEDRPFGPLSNNYKMQLNIEGEKYNSVSNYIYSRCAPNYGGIKNILKNMKPSTVPDECTTLIRRSIIEIAMPHLKNAISEKLKTDKAFRDELFNTGDKSLVYISKMRLFGIDENGEGDNLFGIALEQIRNVENPKHKEDMIKKYEFELGHKIQQSFIANQLLTHLIKSGKSDLLEYLGKSLEDITKTSQSLSTPPPEVVYNMYKSGNIIPEYVLSAIYDPNILIYQLRKLYLRETIARQSDIVGKVLFMAYFKEMTKRKYNNLSDEEINRVYETLLLLTQPDELEEQISSIFTMYSHQNNGFKKYFSVDLYQQMENVFVEYNFIKMIASSKLDEIETYEAPKFSRPEMEDPITIKTDKTSILHIVENGKNILSVENDSGSIIMDGRRYNTIAQYVYTVLFSEFFGYDMKKSLTEMNTGEFLPEVFSKKANDLFNENLVRHAKIALKQKFSDVFLQQLLLATGDRELLWGDKKDHILGIGNDGNGLNIVGLELMELRKKFIRDERKFVKMDINALSDIISMSMAPGFMNEWIKGRIFELLKNAVVISSYYTSNVDSDFMIKLIVELYNKCGLIKNLRSLDSEQKPNSEFINMVKSYIIVKRSQQENKKWIEKYYKINLDDEAVNVIWNYALILMDTIYQGSTGAETKFQDVIDLIVKSQEYLSMTHTCEADIDDVMNKCIMSALINTLEKIKRLAPPDERFVVDENTVDLAIDIILNSDSTIGSSREEKIDEDEEVEVEERKEKIQLRTERSSLYKRRIPIPPGMAGSDGDAESEGYDRGSEISEELANDEEEELPDFFENDPNDEEDIPERENITDKIIMTDVVIGYGVKAEVRKIDENFKDVSIISKAIEKIVKFPMSAKAKRNRINFFATLV